MSDASNDDKVLVFCTRDEQLLQLLREFLEPFGYTVKSAEGDADQSTDKGSSGRLLQAGLLWFLTEGLLTDGIEAGSEIFELLTA